MQIKCGRIGEASPAHAVARLQDRKFFVGGEEAPSGGDSGGARTDDQNVEVGLASGAGKCRA